MSVVMNEPGLMGETPSKRSKGSFIREVLRGRPSAAIGVVLLEQQQPTLQSNAADHRQVVPAEWCPQQRGLPQWCPGAHRSGE